MNNEAINESETQNSNSKEQLTLLKEAIYFLVAYKLGDRAGTNLPMSAYRIRYILYLADLKWYQNSGETFFGYPYQYYSNGPWFKELNQALAALRGPFLSEKGGKYHAKYSYWYSHIDHLDHRFQKMLTDIKQRCYFLNDGSVKTKVYGTTPMQNVAFGDYLFGDTEDGQCGLDCLTSNPELPG